MPRWLSALLLVPVALGVWYYNYWAVGCGRCSYADFWRIDLHTLFWAALIIAGFLFWLFLRRRGSQICTCHSCGRPIDQAWNYCPDCGTPGKPSA